MSSNFNSMFKPSSNIASSFNQQSPNRTPGTPDYSSRVHRGAGSGSRTAGSVGTSFSHQERQTLHDLGQRMRGANANQHALYQKALDELIGDREMTGADARMVALYAKTGSADGRTGSTEEGAKWGEALEALRDVE